MLNLSLVASSMPSSFVQLTSSWICLSLILYRLSSFFTSVGQWSKITRLCNIRRMKNEKFLAKKNEKEFSFIDLLFVFLYSIHVFFLFSLAFFILKSYHKNINKPCEIFLVFITQNKHKRVISLLIFLTVSECYLKASIHQWFSIAEDLE